MSDIQQTPDWWQAADGKWYAPEFHPNFSELEPEFVDGEAESDDDDESDADGKAPKKKRLKAVASFPKAQYLGGLPATKAASGNLIFTAEEVGVESEPEEGRGGLGRRCGHLLRLEHHQEVQGWEGCIGWVLPWLPERPKRQQTSQSF